MYNGHPYFTKMRKPHTCIPMIIFEKTKEFNIKLKLHV